MVIPYQLIRSKRRTLSLIIGANGALTARAPLRMPTEEIEIFIQHKEAWILKKQAVIKQRAQQLAEVRLMDGGSLPYRGETLQIRTGHLPFAFLYHGMLLVPAHQSVLMSVVAWLKKGAEHHLLTRARQLGNAMGVSPVKISFGTARTLWGSMSARSGMRLNLALLLCPSEIADYVIVHELAHIAQPNHSPAFWAVVRNAMPDFEWRRTWLRQNSHLIRFLQPPSGKGTTSKEGGSL